MGAFFVRAVSPVELMEKAGPSPAALTFLNARLSLFGLMADLREAEAGARAGSSPGRSFLLVQLFSVRACAPFAKSEHKAFREKAPSEERSLRWCCCDAGS